MPNQKFSLRLFSDALLWTALASVLFVSGCAADAAKVKDAARPNALAKAELGPNAAAPNAPRGATIEIAADSPADTVRVFYKNLREKKVREAMFLTNLRPAIEGLTDAELADLQVDFEPIARAVPAEVEINGEIISGNYATVTARLPDNEAKEMKLQELRLRKEGDYWIVLTVDEKAEDRIKKDGNKYFFNLRLETQQEEARKMLDRISRAQMVHAVQNGGAYADLKTLVAKGLVPEDAQTPESTGYRYQVTVAPDAKSYFATAEPAEYGKNGKLSFLLELDAKKNARLTSKDNKGAPLKK